MNIGINKNIKRLSGIAAILMLAVVVIGCKHNVNNKPETFNITFNVDGVGGTLKATVDGSEINSGNKVEHGKTVTFTATPDAGYTVKEWKADGSAVTGSTSNTYTCTVTKALTVKVSFLAGGASYTVKHYQEKIEGGYPAEPTETENLTGTVGTNAAYTPKTGGAYEGFTYKSALTKVNNTVQQTGTIAAGNSTVVELFYERNTVQVTFKLAGGNVAGNTADIIKTGKYGTALTAPAPVQTGFVFKGWNPALPSPLLFPKANAEYTAQWEINEYAVTFDAKDGSPTPAAQTVPYKEKASAPSPVPAKEGHTLEGWYNKEGNTPWDFAVNEVTKNTELYAQWKINEYAVTFSVEGTGGKLTAKADGITETEASPITVEHGKEVTFTATADAGYRLKGWTLDGSPITEAGTNTEYKLTVTKACTVKVSFEAIPKHAITFSVDGANGTLKAVVSDKEINSGDEVEQGKEVTFTAQADDGYRVKGWTLDGNAVNGTAETYTLTVTQPAIVKVSFELIPEVAILTLDAGKKDIKVRAKTADGSAIEVKGCNETTLASNTETTLNATGTKVILKGNITELYCENNQLTALNVSGLTSLQKLSCYGNQLTALNISGCTALKTLWCYSNQLNAQAMTELLKGLPARKSFDGAKAFLYTEETGEGNWKDFGNPPELVAAFAGARKRHWKPYRLNISGLPVEM